MAKYEVRVPIRNTWVYEVEANSQEDAIIRVRVGEGERIRSEPGWPKTTKHKVEYESETIQAKRLTQRK